MKTYLFNVENGLYEGETFEEAALLQVPRVARARGISEDELRKVVSNRMEERQFGFLGAPRVNVFVLNQELDGQMKH